MNKEKIKATTKRSYNGVGGNYDSWYWAKGSQELREGLRNEVLSRVDTFKEKKPKILDVCCGTGHLAEPLSERGTYLGIDFSESMINECRKRYPKLKFSVGDAEDLRFKENSFDIVVCFWSFHHITAPEKALDEFRRVLKDGGLLVIATFGPCGLNPLAKLGDWTSTLHYGFRTFRYSEAVMSNLLKRFKSFEIDKYPDYMGIWQAMGISFIIATAIK